MLVPYGKPLIIQMSKETVKRSPRIVYKVIERTMDKNGQLLIMPDIECNTIRKYKLNMALYMAVKRLYL